MKINIVTEVRKLLNENNADYVTTSQVADKLGLSVEETFKLLMQRAKEIEVAVYEGGLTSYLERGISTVWTVFVRHKNATAPVMYQDVSCFVESLKQLCVDTFKARDLVISKVCSNRSEAAQKLAYAAAIGAIERVKRGQYKTREFKYEVL